MTIRDLISYLGRRFPPDAKLVGVEIAAVLDPSTPFVETISLLVDDADEDDPDDGEEFDAPSSTRRPSLRLVP